MRAGWPKVATLISLVVLLPMFNVSHSRANFTVEVSHFTGSGGTGAGDGNSAQSRFLWPRDIVRDNKGNLLVIDSNGLRRIDQAGNTTTVWKHPISGQVFCSMAVDKTDVTWLLDCNGSQVWRITGDGRSLGSIQVAPTGTYSWVKPGMGFLPSGNLIMPSYAQGKILEVSPNGEVKDFLTGSTNVGCGTTPRLLGLICPISVAVSDSGRVYFVNQNASNQWELVQLDSAKNVSVVVPANSQNGWSAYQIRFIGDQLYAAQINPSVLNDSCQRKMNLSILQGNQFQSRATIQSFSDWDAPFTIDALGNFVYVLSSAGQIRKHIVSSGETQLIGSSNIGCQDGQRTSSKFVNPNAIAQDANGNIFVKDDTSLRKIDNSGNVSTLYRADWIQRGGGRLIGSEYYLIANTNRLISINVNSGSVTQRQSYSSGNEYLSTSGSGKSFDVDPQGNLYVIVARSGNFSEKVLRKVTPTGQITDILSFGSSDASILLDGQDNLYVASANNIRRYQTRDFANSTIIANYSGWGAVLSLDSDGSLFLFYSTNTSPGGTTNYFYKTQPGSTSLSLVLMSPVGSDNLESKSTFNQVSDFVKTKNGEWLIADTGNHVIRSMKISTVSATQGGATGAASSSTSTTNTTPNFGYLGYSWLPGGLAEFEFSPPENSQSVTQYQIGARYSTNTCNEADWKANTCSYSQIEIFKSILPSTLTTKGDVTFTSSNGSKRTYKNVQKFFLLRGEMQDFLRTRTSARDRSLSFYIRAVSNSSTTEWSEGVWADPMKIWEGVSNTGTTNSSASSSSKPKPDMPSFSGINLVGNKINVNVNLGSASANRPDKVYLVAPKLGINASNPLVGKIVGSTASWSIDFDSLLGGTMIPLEIVAERDGVSSDPLAISYQAPLATDATKAKSVPIAPKNFKSRIIGNSAVISVEATVKAGSLATGAHLFSNSLGITKSKALKGDVVGTKALIEVPIKASMAGKRYPVTIFLTNDKGESKPLSATLSIPAAPKTPSLPTAIPVPKVPKTVICARSNQTRAFEGTNCPPGWEKR